QMRGEFPVLACDPERRRRFVYIGRERGQRRRLDAAPEIVGRMRIRKEADPSYAHRNWSAPGHRGERLLELAQPLFGKLADELDGDVQVFGPAPRYLRARFQAAQK